MYTINFLRDGANNVVTPRVGIVEHDNGRSLGRVEEDANGTWGAAVDDILDFGDAVIYTNTSDRWEGSVYLNPVQGHWVYVLPTGQEQSFGAWETKELAELALLHALTGV